MDRKCSGLYRHRPKAAPADKSPRRRWPVFVVLPALVAVPVAVMLAVGMPAGYSNTGPVDTVVWHVHNAYGFMERSFGTAGKSVMRSWSRNVVQARWSLDTVILVGALAFVVGGAFMCRKIGR